MTGTVSPAMVDAFYEAYASQSSDSLAPLLHDDIVWTISGPVDVLTYCGVHRGKAAVLRLAGEHVPSIYRIVSFTRDSLLIDGDRVATLNRTCGRLCADARIISYRLAHFIRFLNKRVVEVVSLIDSFDAAEQMLGHALDVHDEAMVADGNLVAV